MGKIDNDPKLIAFCGLYCGSCRKYQKGKCPGCVGNEKAGWCKIRTCCLKNDYKSCADCREYENVMDCKMFNNFMGKLFGFLFGSNRGGSIAFIKEKGYEAYAEEMANKGRMSVK